MNGSEKRAEITEPKLTSGRRIARGLRQIFKSGKSERAIPAHTTDTDEPSLKGWADARNRIDERFRESAEMHKLIEEGGPVAELLGKFNSRLADIAGGKIAAAKVMLSANEVTTQEAVKGLTGALLPEPMDISGLFSMLYGGNTQDIELEPVRHYRERPFSATDAYGLSLFSAQPIATYVMDGYHNRAMKELIVPTEVAGVSLVFSSLGLTHPDNMSENPFTIGLVIGDPALGVA